MDRARRFHQPQLESGEEIVAVRQATAAGTGSRVVLGAAMGALLGWLYALTVDTAQLPPIVLGAFTGEIAGYILANVAASRPNGPGAVHLQVVQTDRRLFTVRRYVAVRRRILRSYPFAEAAQFTLSQYPVGRYHRLDIYMTTGNAASLVVDGNLDLPLNTDTSSR